MSCFSWNVRGFNKTTKHSVVRNWISNNDMQFGCLLETRVKEKKSDRIVPSVFKDWSFMANYEFNQLGRIWVIWRTTVRLSPVFKSDQLITCSVLLEGAQEEFFCSFIYAKNLAEERKSLWEDLRSHHDSQMFKNKPWLLMGDFNEILDGTEHSNFGQSPTLPPGMRDFQELVRYCSLTDMGSHGPLFTWCNKRDEGLVCKKLDRVLMNDIWLRRYSQAYCVYESGGCSDYLRSRIQCAVEPPAKKRPFKFVNVLVNMPEFLPMVQTYWEDTTTLYHSTSAIYRLSKKLKGLKSLIRSLSREKIGDLPRRAKEAFVELCDKQNATLTHPTTLAIKEEAEAYERWSHLSELEEGFYKQKSKLHWLNVGDQNNKAFHNAIKIREAHNTIREIRCDDGSLATTHAAIKKEAVHYFSEFLAHQPADHDGATTDAFEQLLTFKCSEGNKAKLIHDVT